MPDRPMIEVTHRDGVAVLTIRHGRANALDVELCGALDEALDAAAGARGVVLTGTGTIFSAGVDLHRVIAGGEAYVTDLLAALRRTFTRLAFFERPLVAAVNGHAIAGGFVLLSAADRAVMADGDSRIGVTELLVGVPFPAVALELTRTRAGEALVRRLVLDGSTMEARPALARDLVDEVVPAGGLLERSVATACRLADVGPAFSLTKRQLRLELEARIGRLAGLDAEVDAVWRSPRTLERIRSYMNSLPSHAGR